MLKINETPVRTSKNFNINNIELEDVDIPNDISSFSNVKVFGNSSSTSTNNDLVYGLGNELENQVRLHANQRIAFEVYDEDKEVCFKFDKNNLNLIEDIKIIAKEYSKASVIIKYESEEDVHAYHNGIINIEAFENAKLDVVIVNLMNNMSRNFLSIQTQIKNDANVNVTIIDFGGKSSITNYYSNLIGAASKNEINAIYLGKDEQLFDLNYIAHLRGEKSNVNIEVQGALKDSAKKKFKGTIDFKNGCKKAVGNENEACMLLSDTARSLALPMLLCSEEDVEGNHSTSSGKIESKELFYVMSRGLSLKDAMKLLVRARFNRILDKIKDLQLREQILEEIDKRLD